MKIGLGLPNVALDVTDGRTLVTIGCRAEQAGFSTLATIGRIAYPNHEELMTLAAVAGATTRIGLMTNVLLAPAREPVLLGKQAATLDQVSGGRFTLGIGVGGRPDDYSVTGARFTDRGRRLDAALEVWTRMWAGEPIEGTDRPVAPRPVSGTVPLMFGGGSDRALARAAKYGVGYTQGGGTPESLREMMGRFEEAWRQAGREGKPRYCALAYFTAGDDAQARAETNLRDYYGPYGDRVVGGMVRGAEAARRAVAAYDEIGCDEVIFSLPTSIVDEVQRLADAVL